MSTHNLYFYGEISKRICKLLQIPTLIRFSIAASYPYGQDVSGVVVRLGIGEGMTNVEQEDDVVGAIKIATVDIQQQ